MFPFMMTEGMMGNKKNAQKKKKRKADQLPGETKADGRVERVT